METFKRFFKLDSVIIIIAILSLGYFGIVMINDSYQHTIKLAVDNSSDQSKINNANKGLLKFILCDEKLFSEALKENGKLNYSDLKYYKDDILDVCDDSLVNKKLIDSLFNRKILLLKEFESIGSDHIDANVLYTKDTSLKALRFIGKQKISYNVDPKNLKDEIQKFDHTRNNKLNNIIIENFKINFLISNEVHKYVAHTSHKMSENRTDLIGEIDKNLNRFILCVIIVISIIVFLIKILIFDMDRMRNSYDRQVLFIKSLMDLIFKKVS